MSKGRYSIAEARNHLPAIVHEAEEGKPIEITRRGARIAVILSSADYDKLAGGRVGVMDALRAWRARPNPSEIDPDEIFADVRDRSPGREVAL